MKETKCDGCGKIIDGYYPNEEITARGTDYGAHNFDIRYPGQVKPRAEWMLSVDCKWGWEPVEYHFCSAECLKKHTDVIVNVIEYARENETWKRRWKHDEK